MKKISALLIATLVLSGCAAQSDPEGSPSATETASGTSCEKYQGGAQVDSVTIEQGFGVQPATTFPVPLVGEGMQTKVFVAGSGPEVTGSQQVLLHFAAYNAATGEELQATEFGSEQVVPQMLAPNSKPDFCHALSGVKAGSRVAVLLDPANAHDGNGIPTLGVAADDSVLFVFDVVDVMLAKATGEAKPAEAGFPTVILAPSGQPGLQLLKAEPPTEFKRSILIEGEGEEVKVGDTLSVHYSGFLWNDGTQFDSSWEKGQPAQFTISNEGLIEGFVLALDGVSVGSQVVAIIPPEYGYGDAAQGSIPPGSTLIFVIDVLGKLG